MTFRPPLIITIYPRPKAAEPYYNVRISALYTPNPSLPFHQDDWPRPAPPGKVQDSAAPANLYPWQHPNPSKPFHQDDWTQLANPGRPKAVGEAIGTLNVLLTPNPSRPFHQDDWSQVAALARPKAKVDDFVNLLSQTFFIISQDLWDNPISKPKAKVDDFVNLLPVHSGSVVVQPPFSQEVWDSATLSRPKITDTSLGLLSPLLTPNPAVPFIQDIWDGTAHPWPKASGEAQGGDAPLLTPNPSIPFSQALWDGEPARGKARVDDFVNLLPIQSGIVVVQNPFGSTDWPRPATPQSKVMDTSLAGSAPLYTPNPAVPFTSWDIAILDRPPLVQVDAVVNTLPQLLPGTPFTLGQDDWPSPALPRQKIYAESFGIDLPLKFPNPTRPFQQSDWASATRGFPAAAGHFYPINPNLQPPPIIIPAKPDNLHFLADVGRMMSR